MFRTLDLKRLIVASDDPRGVARSLEAAFDLARVEAPEETPRLSIGGAEIEVRAVGGEAGLSRLVLEVDDLEAARQTLAARGIPIEPRELDGRRALDVSPAHSHGAPLTLVARSEPARSILGSRSGA